MTTTTTRNEAAERLYAALGYRRLGQRHVLGQGQVVIQDVRELPRRQHAARDRVVTAFRAVSPSGELGLHGLSRHRTS